MSEPDPADDLVRFAETLSDEERREYEALAKLDAEHGEDVFLGEQVPIVMPDPEAVARAWLRIAPAFELPARASDTAIRIALREADHLTDDIYDAPAALLFTLGRYPRCFSGFRTMSVMLVRWHAQTLGFKLEASVTELAEKLGEVARHEVEFEVVRSWLGARLLPFGG